jgi:hypothetical protein
MRSSTIALWLASSLAASASFAQQQPSPRTPAQPEAQQPIAVSDAELDTFATIYVDLLQTVAKFKQEIQSAQSDQEAQGVRGRMQEESVAKLAKRGWTPEKFQSITEAVNRDPALGEKVAKLIEQKS